MDMEYQISQIKKFKGKFQNEKKMDMVFMKIFFVNLKVISKMTKKMDMIY